MMSSSCINEVTGYCGEQSPSRWLNFRTVVRVAGGISSSLIGETL